ncbi:hypothetical protein JW949_04225 [Candidatus Woesearchaeota archaeon]|nr:hypothetical protein [Candidatus Woesearchaeota archaeon]
MRPDFEEGFTVYRNGSGVVFITQHSGPNLETPTSRDEYSDMVASLCFRKVGGTFILSNISRKRIWGIDFNRMKPQMDMALKYYKNFEADINRRELVKYRKKYAWVAADKKDHDYRERIYDLFWSTVRRSGVFFIFLHTKFTRPKNFPIIMDVVNFRGKGINTRIMKKIIAEINKTNNEFFRSIKDLYIEEAAVESRRRAYRIKKVFGDFSIKKSGIEYKKNLKKDFSFIKKYGDKEFVENLINNFTSRNFVLAAKNAMENAPAPYVSLNEIFGGETAYGPKTELKMGQDNVVLEIEVSEFMNKFFPEEASDIILAIVNSIQNLKRYKKLSKRQSELPNFI